MSWFNAIRATQLAYLKRKHPVAQDNVVRMLYFIMDNVVNDLKAGTFQCDGNFTSTPRILFMKYSPTGHVNVKISLPVTRFTMICNIM